MLIPFAVFHMMSSFSLNHPECGHESVFTVTRRIPPDFHPAILCEDCFQLVVDVDAEARIQSVPATFGTVTAQRLDHIEDCNFIVIPFL